MSEQVVSCSIVLAGIWMSIAFGNVRTTKKMVQTFIILSTQGILVLLLFAVGMLQQWKNYVLDLAMNAACSRGQQNHVM